MHKCTRCWCLCVRCWIVMAERNWKQIYRHQLSFYIHLSYWLLRSRVSPVYPPRHTTTFYACQIILKTRQAVVLGYLLYLVFFRFVLSLSFSWFSLLCAIQLCCALAREREGTTGFWVVVSHSQWDRLMHRYRTTQCASRPFDLYTMCALREHTGAPQLSYFPCRRWIWQNNRRQGAQHSHVIATDSVAIATTDGSIHILLWCMLYLR